MLIPTLSNGRGLSGPLVDGRPGGTHGCRRPLLFREPRTGTLSHQRAEAGFAAVVTRGPEQVDVVAGQRRAAEMALQRGGAIAGTVLDERAQPLAGARVVALCRFPRSLWEQGVTTAATHLISLTRR
jgi:hypothetical protein